MPRVSGRKEVRDLVDWLQRAANKPLMTSLTANGHIGFADAETGIPIRRRDGSILAISNSPSGYGWKQAAVNEFAAMGLIRQSLLDTAKRRSQQSRHSDELTKIRNRRAELALEDAALEKKLRKLERAA